MILIFQDLLTESKVGSGKQKDEVEHSRRTIFSSSQRLWLDKKQESPSCWALFIVPEQFQLTGGRKWSIKFMIKFITGKNRLEKEF